MTVRGSAGWRTRNVGAWSLMTLSEYRSGGFHAVPSGRVAARWYNSGSLTARAAVRPSPFSPNGRSGRSAPPPAPKTSRAPRTGRSRPSVHVTVGTLLDLRVEPVHPARGPPGVGGGRDRQPATDDAWPDRCGGRGGRPGDSITGGRGDAADRSRATRGVGQRPCADHAPIPPCRPTRTTPPRAGTRAGVRRAAGHRG